MARFPYREADVARLAQDLIAGLTAHTEDFPAPPVPPDELQTALSQYPARRRSSARRRPRRVRLPRTTPCRPWST
jgi:hypothetical protein